MKITTTVDMDDVFVDQGDGFESTMAVIIRDEVMNAVLRETRAWAKANITPSVKSQLEKQFPRYKESVISKAVSAAMAELERGE